MRYLETGQNILLQDGFTMTDAVISNDTYIAEFDNKDCVVVRNFIDQATIKTISMYLENQFKLASWEKRKENFSFQEEPSAHSKYSDPLIEVVLQNVVPDIESIVGFEVEPTYSFSRIYVKGDKLTPHVDRPSCEISATVNVATVGELWPIWMKARGKEPIKVELNPGDAVIYKGCEVTHWRDEMIDTEVNVQFMLHFVNKNGPYADYKWDKRPGLGHSSDTRSK